MRHARGPDLPDAPGPTAYVIEGFDPEDDGRLTGQFSAHWESASGESWRQGPGNVPIEEAIAWARRQARVVMVRLRTHDYYSAGVEPPPEVPRRWPSDGMTVRPRPVGTPVDGRQQLVRWADADTVPGSGDASRSLAELVRDVLADSKDVVGATVEATPDGDLVVDCVVLANGMRAAIAAYQPRAAGDRAFLLDGCVTGTGESAADVDEADLLHGFGA